jgi:hypothetical protein
MIYILKNHTFKRNILINKFNLDFILKEKKNIRYYINANLNDRSFAYLSIADIKDYQVLEGS